MADQVDHDVEELAGEVFCDSFYVGVDDGLFAGSGLEVLEVRKGFVTLVANNYPSETGTVNDWKVVEQRSDTE